MTRGFTLTGRNSQPATTGLARLALAGSFWHGGGATSASYFSEFMKNGYLHDMSFLVIAVERAACSCEDANETLRMNLADFLRKEQR
jgi:hypothetical protein